MDDTSNLPPNPKNRGLGRGLNALFEDDGDTAAAPSPAAAAESVAAAGGGKRLSIPIAQIAPHIDQPRQSFKDDTLDELAESIKEYGVLQPILLRPLSDGKEARYEIIAGERRWRAAQKAMLHEIPAIVLDMDDEEAYKIALIENLQREDLSPLNEARGYEYMMFTFGYTQEKVAEAVGKSRPHVANMLRLLTLPLLVQTFIGSGDLTVGHARAIANSEDPVALANQIIKNSLSVRQAEALASSGKKGGAGAGNSGGKGRKSREDKSHVQSFGHKDPDTILLEADLSAALGMTVSIDSRDGKSGTISIGFKDLDQLDELLQRLSTRPASQRLMG